MWQGWIELGLPQAEFWDVTLREYSLIRAAKIKAKDGEIAARRVLNQELAKLIAYAFHDPKKMPDFTRAPEKKEAPMGEREAKIRMQSHMISLFAQSRKGT